jgi:hypothetical protein
MKKPKNFKYTFHKCKKKYSKPLLIYEKIDSNYNLMNISKKLLSTILINPTSMSSTMASTLFDIDNKELPSDPSINIFDTTSSPNIILKNQPLLETTKTVILIKGYFLVKSTTNSDHTCPNIAELHQNTINILNK